MLPLGESVKRDEEQLTEQKAAERDDMPGHDAEDNVVVRLLSAGLSLAADSVAVR